MTDPPSRPKHWRWRIVLLIVLAGCGYLGRFSYLRITRRPTPRVSYWEARLAELDPPGPDALRPQEAVDLLGARPWENDPRIASTFNLSTRGGEQLRDLLRGPWDPQRYPVRIAESVFESEAFQTARDDLKDAARRGWGYTLPLDVSAQWGWGNPGDHQVWVDWLLAHARWAWESRGDLPTAIEDCIMALGVTRQLHRCWSEYVRMSATELAAGVADEMMLAAGQTAQPAFTAALAASIDDIFDPSPDPARLVEPDRLTLHCFLEFWYVREGGDWMDVSELAEAWKSWIGFGWGGLTTPRPSRLWKLLSPVYHDLPTARQTVEDHCEAARAWTDLRAMQRAFEALVDAPRLGAVDGFIGWTPGFGIHAVTGYYWMRMRLDAALAMLAIHAYHHEHGRYPEQLDDLVPAFLPRLPIDYVDREPLRYRLTGADYCLYSIGIDGDDDRGQGGMDWGYHEFYDRQDGDLVFSGVKRRSAE